MPGCKALLRPTPRERVKLFHLALGRYRLGVRLRHTSYEMFYAGAGYAVRNNSYRTYEWGRATGLVERLLAGYGLVSEE